MTDVVSSEFFPNYKINQTDMTNRTFEDFEYYDYDTVEFVVYKSGNDYLVTHSNSTRAT